MSRAALRPVALASKRRANERLKVGGWRWRISPEYSGLLTPGALPTPTPPEGAEILRQARGRTVYRTVLPGGIRVVVKVFREVVAGDHLRRFFGSRGVTEWNALGRAVALGIPAPRRLALGTRGSEAVLVLAELSDHEPLDRALARLGKGHAGRARLADGVADLLSTLHARGVEHRDLHPGNILVPTSGGRELYIVDLHKARFRRRLGLEARLRDLSDLDLYFAWHGERTLRVRAARRYLMGLAGELIRGDAEVLERRTRQLIGHLGRLTLVRSRELWRQRDELARGGNSRFSIFSDPEGGTGVNRATLPWLVELCLNADSYLAQPTAISLKDGTSTSAALVPLSRPPTGETSVFLKRFNRLGWLESLKTLLRGTRASRAFHAGWALEVRAIPSPAVLAYADLSTGRSVLVTEALVGWRNLAVLLADPAEAGRDRTALWRSLARWLKRMHVSGVSHRDLKCVNLLVPESADDPRLAIVDLDGVMVHPAELSWRRRARDLARWIADVRARGGLREPDAEATFLTTYLTWLVEESHQRARLLGAIEAWRARQRRRAP